jgi:hypothetical protein
MNSPLFMTKVMSIFTKTTIFASLCEKERGKNVILERVGHVDCTEHLQHTFVLFVNTFVSFLEYLEESMYEREYIYHF